MAKLTQFLGLVFFFLFFSSSVFSKNNQYENDKQIIIDNIFSMWKAVEQGDLDNYIKYFHKDYTLFGEGDAYLRKGKSNEKVDIGDYLKRAKNVRTMMHHPEVIIRGDTAWITYYWSDSGYMNNQRFTSRGKSTRIFVKENGQWLCIHSHFTEQA
ncbi:YybH family protein [Aliikangiella maris]|uniref:Nuclear transport factor 2 family protein n=2 Tax=Aliikangiella maris TaxID=3162458 RepID=A0ABV3MMA1_9GAMM